MSLRRSHVPRNDPGKEAIGLSTTPVHTPRGISAILDPRSIAVVGASRSATTIGHQIVSNLVTYGFTGPVFPINPNASSLGIYFAGGKGRYSRQTPSELMAIADKTGLNGTELVRSSRLSASTTSTSSGEMRKWIAPS